MSLPNFRLHQTKVRTDDDRVHNYYDFGPSGAEPPYLKAHQAAAAQFPPGERRILEKPSEMRWHPVMGQWVVYAAHRMNRPQLPSRDACPLCPGVLELPGPYQIAIFENKAPALSYVPGDWALPDVEEAFEVTVPGRGRCDLVVYSQDHDTKFAHMDPVAVYGLIEAWRSRYAELLEEPEIKFVSIFENKGRDAGMTLDHPHGQIYSFSFLPPDLERQLERTRKFAARGVDLWQAVIDKELRDGTRIVAETDHFLAAMPFYARFPYEVHIWAKRAGVHSLLEMSPPERRDLAGIMQTVTLKYENLWPGNAFGFPTLMLMQQLSNLPGVENYRFHIEFYPLQRSPDKLKYRASIETGAGTSLNDALPERQASELAQVSPQTVLLPDVLFE